MLPDTPIEKLFMIGPTYAKRLKKLEIKTLNDFLYHFPFRYLDFSLTSSIGRIQIGETVSIKGEISSFKNEYTKNFKKIQKATIVDQTGFVEVIWFNQPFLSRILKVGLMVSVAGKVDWFGRKKALISPEYEIIKDGKQTIHTAGLVPIYHETYGLSSKWIRSRIAPLIKTMLLKTEDFLPAKIVKKYNLMDLKTSLEQIHFPENQKMTDKARERFAFEELFLLQLTVLKRKMAWRKKKLAFNFLIDKKKIDVFTKALPFKLTGAQKRVIEELLTDLAKKKPMNRLLEGDVGSGKTVVAAAGFFYAFLNGLKSVLMAPTEILTNQHFLTLNQLLTPLGLKIGLLTGSQKKDSGKNDFDLLIGTHALLYKKDKFKRLGLVVIDEQHRFGVEQRAKLISQTSQKTPHILTMTATPIPRTVALTLYGDLDLCVLDEMPAGRQIVKTWLVPSKKRQAAYGWIKKQIKKNKSQAFVVCPFIEESTSETLQTVKAVVTEFKQLQKKIFPKLKLGLLHGRLKAKEKQEVLGKFRKGKIDILVSTPVVEVGIDIPNATVMVVEGAERFGLAQLHQLRGRVGRGKKQSYCLLFSEQGSERITKRLKAMQDTHTGMELAETDLKIRGPGEIYGTHQHGFGTLKVASFADWKLIEETKQAAEKTIKKIHLYPRLRKRLKKDKIRPN